MTTYTVFQHNSRDEAPVVISTEDTEEEARYCISKMAARIIPTYSSTLLQIRTDAEQCTMALDFDKIQIETPDGFSVFPPFYNPLLVFRRRIHQRTHTPV